MTDNIIEISQHAGEKWEQAREAYLRLEWRRNGYAARFPSLTEDDYVDRNRKNIGDDTLSACGAELIEQARRELVMMPWLHNALAEVMGKPTWVLQLGKALPGQRHEVHVDGRVEKVGGTFFRVLKSWAVGKPATVAKRETVKQGMEKLGLPVPEPDNRTKRGGTYLCPLTLKGLIATL